MQICHCNASTLPHFHQKDGIKDATAEEQAEAVAGYKLGRNPPTGTSRKIG